MYTNDFVDLYTCVADVISCIDVKNVYYVFLF